MFNKKSQIKLLMWLFIATLSFIVILGLWKLAFSKAPDKASEDTCFIFNAIRTKAKLEVARKEILSVPRACKKIEKTGDKAIPEDIYQQNNKGAKDQLSNMITKCWWMWLEGRDPNIMEGNIFYGKNKCFICYQFDVDEEISFTATKFDKELFENTYRFEDSSDKCAGALGGMCFDGDKCEKDYNKIGKCSEGKVCCVHKKNVCENKGGTCRTKGPCDSKTEALNPDLKCEEGACCIKKENQLTYYEYIQEFGGPGRIIIDRSIGNFESSGTYAVTFIGRSDDLILKNIPLLQKLDLYNLEIATILVSNLKDVDRKCQIELGTEAGVSG